MRFSLTVLALGAASLVSGCAGFAFAPNGATQGSIYTGTQATTGVTSNKVGSKMGEACAMSILGVVSLGDLTVTTAAKAGGITTISNVDHEFTNIIGVYSKYCTRVYGD
jgi:hypothetical protein